VIVARKTDDDDEFMLAALEAGAEDMEDQGDTWQVTTAPGDLTGVRAGLEAAGIVVESADLSLIPTTTVALESEADARKVLRLIDLLEDHDDVQAVYANFDVPDELLQTVEA
jgi:transcriptional/translational regulatory protein YebC/TACO1